MPLMLQQKLISHRLAQLITHPFSRTCLADVLTIIISIIDKHTQIPFHYLVSYPDPPSTMRGESWYETINYLEILCAFSKVLGKVSDH